MRMSRLFVDVDLSVGYSVPLDEESAHYLRTVLRLKPGQFIVLFNGAGGEYIAEVDQIDRKMVSVNVKEWTERSAESSLAVHIGIGISRGDRMDWSIQKAVELGAVQITPLISERCLIKFTTEKRLQRFLHWKQIVRHAAEQSGRTVLPVLNPVMEMVDWIGHESSLKIFLDPHSEQKFSELAFSGAALSLMTGPEGGFSKEEGQMAINAGFQSVQLGKRVLRTETAVLTALSAVQVRWGDF